MEVAAFPRRFATLPVVTIGMEVDDAPSVVIDNCSGMRAVAEHLIGEHRRERPAFILGPARHRDAEDRFRAYCDALAAFGIPLREELVVQGDFKEGGGAAAARVLMERGVPFDALIASSDNMAIGALKALQAAGHRVPDEIALGGVNDESQSRFVTPPLTTAALWFYEQGYQACSMLLRRLAGETTPTRVVLPPQLLVRQSCGCLDPLISGAGAAPSRIHRGLDACEAALRQLADSAGRLLADQVAGLGLAIMHACADELEGGQQGRFLNILRDALSASEAAGIPFST